MVRQKMFNENGRVQVPALVHLTRLGYQYVTRKDFEIDNETVILRSVFYKQFLLINGLSESEGEEIFDREFINIKLELEQDDLAEYGSEQSRF